jgi:hypothetical protein
LGLPNFAWIVFDPSGLRVELPILLLGGSQNDAGGVKHGRAGGNRALAESKYGTLRNLRSCFWFPAGLVIAPPELRCILIVFDVAVGRVEVQLTVHAPGDVAQVQHGDAFVAFRDGGVGFLARADAVDEVVHVNEVQAKAAGADRISRVPLLRGPKLLDLLIFLVKDGVVVAFEQSRATGAINQRPTAQTLDGVIVAGTALPSDRLAFGIIPCDDLSVGELTSFVGGQVLKVLQVEWGRDYKREDSLKIWTARSTRPKRGCLRLKRRS